MYQGRTWVSGASNSFLIAWCHFRILHVQKPMGAQNPHLFLKCFWYCQCVPKASAWCQGHAIGGIGCVVWFWTTSVAQFLRYEQSRPSYSWKTLLTWLHSLLDYVIMQVTTFIEFLLSDLLDITWCLNWKNPSFCPESSKMLLFWVFVGVTAENPGHDSVYHKFWAATNPHRDIQQNISHVNTALNVAARHWLAWG